MRTSDNGFAYTCPGQIFMLFLLGIAPDLDDEHKAEAEARVDNDPTAVTAVLIDAYRRWAKAAEGPAVRELSLSVIGCLAMPTKAAEVEIPRLFEMLRDSAITNN
ncbi:hypothetical protein ACWD4G_38435 [Streptomyces sp. NPDC002643]